MSGVLGRIVTHFTPVTSPHVKAFAEAPSVYPEGREETESMVTTKAFIGEQDRADLVSTARKEYERRVLTVSRTLESVKNKIAQTRKDRIAHEQLLEDAIKLSERCDELIDQSKMVVEEAAKERELAVEEEKEYERMRAEAHARAVKAEQKRAEAQAEWLLNEQRRTYADELQRRHRDGIEFTNALERKQEFELQEKEAFLKRVEFMVQNVESFVKGSEFSPSRIELEVAVQAKQIPEIHTFKAEQTQGTSLRAVIEENIAMPITPRVQEEKISYSRTKEVSESKSFLRAR
jgi:hypothetical protein